MLGIAAALVAGLVAATGDDDGAIPTPDRPGTTGAPSTAPPPGADIPVPVDPEVRVGRLANGLTYYLRRNTAPGGRAELRLAVDAGSVLEEDDQLGVAHFLEHMMFNGTARYPANDLIAVLESFGTEFGPDINAYTSFDETVYELGVPTDDPQVVATAVEVLREWAREATLDPGEVEAERGVVIEEWRQRDLGVDARIIQAYEDQLLAGSRYAEREPIGEISQLETMGADRLRRFYDTWYRPDLMAVVIAGDIDVDEMETLVETTFGDLPAPPPADAPERPDIPMDLAAIEPVVVNLDAELPNAFAEIMYPLIVEPVATAADWNDQVAVGLATDMILTRLTNDAIRGEAPYLSVSPTGNAFVRPFDAPGLLVDADPADLAASIDHVLVEIERARRFGFSDAELERARSAARRRAQQAYDERASIQDVERADAYVANFLADAPIPGADDALALELGAIDTLSGDDVSAAIDDLLDTTTTVAVFGPESAAADLPTVEDVTAMVASAADADVEPRPEEAVVDTLMAPPEPAEVVERTTVPGLDAELLVLENGVRVITLTTDITEDRVVFGSTSPGGISLLPDDQVLEAGLVADLVVQSGAGALDQVALDQLVADQVVDVYPLLDETSEGFVGSASVDDLETLFQLVHLYATEPRVDQVAVDNLLGQIRPVVAAPDQYPGVAVSFALAELRYGTDSRQRTVFAPSAAELDGFSTEDALAAFTDRYGDLDDSVFVFAGDIDHAAIEDLARRYLGTLPDTRPDETWRDLQADPPPGIAARTVPSGTDEQGGILFALSGTLPRTTTTEVRAAMLQAIVDTRLRNRIREELSASYSPSSQLLVSDRPDELIESIVQVSGDPARLDEIATEVLGVLGNLRDEGPTADELATAQEQLRRQYELYSNEEWVQALLFYAERPDQDPGEYLERGRIATATTGADIQELAAIAFPPDRYIEIRQVPAG